MNNITLFSSGSISLALISYLLSKNILACVVVTSREDSDSTLLLDTLIQHKIPYFKFDIKNSNNNLDNLKQVQSDLALVFGFPYKLDKTILEHYKHNVFNIHASDLPKYKGNQPFFWQLKNGEKTTALTLYKMTEEFDSGDIVVQKHFDINDKDTFGIFVGIVSQVVISLVEDFLNLIQTHGMNLPLLEQIGDESQAPKVEHKDIVVLWVKMLSVDIVNLTRACNPIFGGAQTVWKNSTVSILEATAVTFENSGLEAGTILNTTSPDGLIVATVDAAIRIDVISVADGYFSGLRFAKRFNLDVGERFTSMI